jgi:glucokinase
MRDPESVLGWVVDATRSCLEELAVSADAVLGLGIGLPARVDFAAGRPLSPVLMPGWDAYDVPAFFRERLTPNVLVDNDVNLLAVNERAVTWPDADDLLYVKLSTGLGGGLIMGGEVQRGASGTAGDIGHIRIRTPGAPGDAPQESIAIGEYADGRRLIRTLADEGFEVSSVEDIVGLVRRGEPRVLELLRQIGRVLGEVLASLVDVLNPAVIVLGGRLGNEGEHLLAGVRDSVYRLSLPAATQNLQIVQSRAGEFGAALGAARLILEDALSPAKVAAAVAG